MLFAISLTACLTLLYVLHRVPSCPHIFLWYIGLGVARDVYLYTTTYNYAWHYRIALIPMLFVISAIAVRSCFGGRFWPLIACGLLLAIGVWWAEGGELFGVEAGVYLSAGVLMLLSLARLHPIAEMKLTFFFGFYFLIRGALVYAYPPLYDHHLKFLVRWQDWLFRIPESVLILSLILTFWPQMEAGRILDSHAAATIPATPQEVLRVAIPLVKKQP